MRSFKFNSHRFFTYGLIIVALAACSKTSLRKGSSAVVVGPANVGSGVIKTIKCQLEVPGTVVNGYDDGAGNLLAGTTAPALTFKVRGTRDGSSADFFVLRSSFDNVGLRQEGAITFNDDRSANLTFRPQKPGKFPVEITIASPQDTSVTDTCRSEVELRTTRPAQTQVLIAANGSLVQLPAPVANSSPVRLNWASINATSCSLFSNNIQIPNVTQTAGELITGPLSNPTAAPVVFVFEARCVASTGGAIVSAQVRVPVNPTASAALSIVNYGASAKVRKGTTVDIQWSSQFAACTLGDGAIQEPVPSTGIRPYVANATKSFVLLCRDLANNVSQASVQVIALNPGAAIFANNTRSAYTKGAGDITVRWESTDVNSCAVSPFNSTEKDGSRVVNPTANTTYAIVCQSDLGEMRDQVVVTVPGAWVACDQNDCQNACSRAGKVSAPSPEGAYCASGEVLPASAIGKIPLTYGVWPKGTENVQHGNPSGAQLQNRYCYSTNKKDSDRTDRAIGVFCK